MKKKINRCLLSFLILFLALFLTGFRKMKTSDYNKVRGVIVENSNKVGLHGKVTITKLYWTALEIPTYHLTYTLKQKSVQKVEKKTEKQLKKQKLGLPISSFSFLSNFNHA